MHVVRPSVVLILVLPRRSSLSRVATLLGFWRTLLSVSLDLKTNLCRFLHALLVLAEAEGHQRPAVWKVLPTASAVSPVLDHSCWTHFLGEVDWRSTGCTASWCHRLCSNPSQCLPLPGDVGTKSLSSQRLPPPRVSTAVPIQYQRPVAGSSKSIQGYRCSLHPAQRAAYDVSRRQHEQRQHQAARITAANQKIRGKWGGEKGKKKEEKQKEGGGWV